jgi:hypothetical protein
MDALNIFYEYKRLGYQIIPLMNNTKRPIFKAWNKKYSFAKIENFLKQNPGNYNFGILLGEVIDIEGDNQAANDFLDDVLKKIPHPSYRSSKSTHHLFRRSGKFFTRNVCNGIEFRGYGHQSVVPPSKHEDGKDYIWLTKILPVNCLPTLPPELEYQIKKFRIKNKDYTKPHSKKILCYGCKEICYINKRRLQIELLALSQTNQKWMCNPCRSYDLRDQVRQIRKSSKSNIVF